MVMIDTTLPGNIGRPWHVASLQIGIITNGPGGVRSMNVEMRLILICNEPGSPPFVFGARFLDAFLKDVKNPNPRFHEDS